MATLEQLISTFEGDNTARGKMFERACKWLLENDPTYNNLRKVWLWDDWPERWDIDRGIDLIARALVLQVVFINGRRWPIRVA